MLEQAGPWACTASRATLEHTRVPQAHGPICPQWPPPICACDITPFCHMSLCYLHGYHAQRGPPRFCAHSIGVTWSQEANSHPEISGSFPAPTGCSDSHVGAARAGDAGKHRIGLSVIVGHPVSKYRISCYLKKKFDCSEPLF